RAQCLAGGVRRRGPATPRAIPGGPRRDDARRVATARKGADDKGRPPSLTGPCDRACCGTTASSTCSSAASTGLPALPQQGRWHLRGGKADRVALLEVHWPTSGTTQVFRDIAVNQGRSEEHTSELQSRGHLVCR